MKKKGIAAFGDLVSNLASGKTSNYVYPRQEILDWDVNENEYLFISNVNIIDVNTGSIRKEKGILIRNKKIEEFVSENDFKTVRERFTIKKEIYGDNRYLIPGLSDIHAHLSLISEFDLGLKGLRYFDAQRQKNCEEALKNGCTFVRDSAGASNVINYLKQEIEQNKLLGPRIIAATEAISPKGGMWDLGFANLFTPMIFGGKVMNFPAHSEDLEKIMDRLYESGCDFFKTYFEDKPIYGGKDSTVYNMFTREQAEFIKNKAMKFDKMVEAHSMFIKGSRRVIDAKLDTIAHLTVDEPYSLDDAEKMKQNNVAIVPTLSIGCYLAMDCGNKGFPDNPDFNFFKVMLNEYLPGMIEKSTIPQLRKNYMSFYNWINREMENRKMPAVGQVYPERIHGFSKNARESLKNFRMKGVKVGVGTDGGTGITFVGNLQIEFEAFHHFGYSPAEVLRMATLGNMEILHLDEKLGSIDKEKFADMVIVKDNPLNSIKAISNVCMVFKDGRLYYQAS